MTESSPNIPSPEQNLETVKFLLAKPNLDKQIESGTKLVGIKQALETLTGEGQPLTRLMSGYDVLSRSSLGKGALDQFDSLSANDSTTIGELKDMLNSIISKEIASIAQKLEALE